MNTSANNNEIMKFIARHGVSDKDAFATRAPSGKKTIKKNRRGLLRKIIDLHGMTSGEAEISLFKSFDECKKKGIKEMLIIHGIGKHSDPAEDKGVLKKMVRDNLEIRYRFIVRNYETALPKDGGDGATLVKLN
jgi:DNA-nicking Smr family endonuclease